MTRPFQEGCGRRLTKPCRQAVSPRPVWIVASKGFTVAPLSSTRTTSASWEPVPEPRLTHWPSFKWRDRPETRK